MGDDLDPRQLVTHTTPEGVSVYHQDAFPRSKSSIPKPALDRACTGVDGRPVVAHRSKSFDHVNNNPSYSVRLRAFRARSAPAYGGFCGPPGSQAHTDQGPEHAHARRSG